MKLTVEFEPRDDTGEWKHGRQYSPEEATAEVLFNFGIGEPENGEPWPNMEGQAYHITRYKIEP